jgi:hypothetical protein
MVTDLYEENVGLEKKGTCVREEEKSEGALTKTMLRLYRAANPCVHARCSTTRRHETQLRPQEGIFRYVIHIRLRGCHRATGTTSGRARLTIPRSPTLSSRLKPEGQRNRVGMNRGEV